MARKKTLEELYSDIEQKFPQIEYVEGFTKYREPCVFRCKKSNKLFSYEPRYIFMKRKCFCEDCRQERDKIAHAQVADARINSKEYILQKMQETNPGFSVIKWDEKHRTHDYVTIKCNNCGTEKRISIMTIMNCYSPCSICADRISYPNKFLRGLLSQFDNIKPVFEYHNDWTAPYYYDCYFELNNQRYIIEMDGAFHYVDSTFSNHQDVQNNDAIKDTLAKNHNVKLIRIDAQVSKPKYLQNNIMNSALSTILDLSIVNWKQVVMFAGGNVLQLVSDYYLQHKGCTTTDISKAIGFSHRTINNYLNTAHEIGLLYYARDKCPIFFTDHNNNKLFFESILSCERYLKSNNINISHQVISMKLNNSNSTVIKGYKFQKFLDFGYKYTRKEDLLNEHLFVQE